MDQYEINYDDYQMSEILQTIRALSLLPKDKKTIMQMASVLGIHMCKLQKEFNYPPIFPENLIPLPKSDLKSWGYKYALQVIKKQRILRQYQQDAALYFTRFREIAPGQWDAIRTGSVENIVLYNAEIRDKRSSSLPIFTEFKSIIDSYRAEYDSEVIELHSFLKSNKSNGCMFFLVFFVILNSILLWFIV